MRGLSRAIEKSKRRFPQQPSISSREVFVRVCNGGWAMALKKLAQRPRATAHGNWSSFQLAMSQLR